MFGSAITSYDRLLSRANNVNNVLHIRRVVGIDASTPSVNLAGAPGIEPGNAGIKTPCLTAWLRPNIGLLFVWSRYGLCGAAILPVTRARAYGFRLNSLYCVLHAIKGE